MLHDGSIFTVFTTRISLGGKSRPLYLSLSIMNESDQKFVQLSFVDSVQSLEARTMHHTNTVLAADSGDTELCQVHLFIIISCLDY